MVRFKALIKKFNVNGEKTAWTYIEIPVKIADKLSPGNKKSYRVKGKLDQVEITALSLVPVGNGQFILPLKKELRKALKKDKGAELVASIEVDDNPEPFPVPDDMNACFDDEPEAKARFFKMAPSHRRYYIKWIESAKTEATRTKRIALTITSLIQNKDFGQMLREQKKENLK